MVISDDRSTSTYIVDHTAAIEMILFLQDLEFFGVMRFFFQDSTSKVATKCIRVASSATTQDVLDTLVEKFRPDMRMLTLPHYSLYEVHANGGKATRMTM